MVDEISDQPNIFGKSVIKEPSFTESPDDPYFKYDNFDFFADRFLDLNPVQWGVRQLRNTHYQPNPTVQAGGFLDPEMVPNKIDDPSPVMSDEDQIASYGKVVLSGATLKKVGDLHNYEKVRNEEELATKYSKGGFWSTNIPVVGPVSTMAISAVDPSMWAVSAMGGAFARPLATSIVAGSKAGSLVAKLMSNKIAVEALDATVGASMLMPLQLANGSYYGEEFRPEQIPQMIAINGLAGAIGGMVGKGSEKVWASPAMSKYRNLLRSLPESLKSKVFGYWATQAKRGLLPDPSIVEKVVRAEHLHVLNDPKFREQVPDIPQEAMSFPDIPEAAKLEGMLETSGLMYHHSQGEAFGGGITYVSDFDIAKNDASGSLNSDPIQEVWATKANNLRVLNADQPTPGYLKDTLLSEIETIERESGMDLSGLKSKVVTDDLKAVLRDLRDRLDDDAMDNLNTKLLEKGRISGYRFTEDGKQMVYLHSDPTTPVAKVYSPKTDNPPDLPWVQEMDALSKVELDPASAKDRDIFHVSETEAEISRLDKISLTEEIDYDVEPARGAKYKPSKMEAEKLVDIEDVLDEHKQLVALQKANLKLEKIPSVPEGLEEILNSSKIDQDKLVKIIEKNTVIKEKADKLLPKLNTKSIQQLIDNPEQFEKSWVTTDTFGELGDAEFKLKSFAEDLANESKLTGDKRDALMYKIYRDYYKGKGREKMDQLLKEYNSSDKTREILKAYTACLLGR